MPWLFGPQDLGNTLFFPTIVLGLAFASIYGYRCWRGLSTYRQASLLSIFLRCGSLVTGILLMVITVTSAINGAYTPLPLPTFIGGILVAAESARGLYDEIFKPGPPKNG
jgi:hypothetical protein